MDDERLTLDNLFVQLKKIVQIAEKESSPDDGIGILTAGDRDAWAKNRLTLMKGTN